jgi:hypothetical protein
LTKKELLIESVSARVERKIASIPPNVTNKIILFEKASTMEKTEKMASISRAFDSLSFHVRIRIDD